MANEQERIEELKTKIENATARKNRLEGEREGLAKQLKELGCKTLKDARAKLVDIKARRDASRTALDEALTELEGQVGMLG